jgi:hypothetical protein
MIACVQVCLLFEGLEKKVYKGGMLALVTVTAARACQQRYDTIELIETKI